MALDYNSLNYGWLLVGLLSNQNDDLQNFLVLPCKSFISLILGTCIVTRSLTHILAFVKSICNLHTTSILGSFKFQGITCALTNKKYVGHL